MLVAAAAGGMPDLIAAPVPSDGTLKGRSVWGYTSVGDAFTQLLDDSVAWPDRVAYNNLPTTRTNTTFFWAYSQWVYATDLQTKQLTLITQMTGPVYALCSGYDMLIAVSKTRVMVWRNGMLIRDFANPITNVAFIYLRIFCSVVDSKTFALTADGWHWQGASAEADILRSQVLLYNVDNGASKLFPLPDEYVGGIATAPGVAAFLSYQLLFIAPDFASMSYASPWSRLSVNAPDSIAIVPSTKTAYVTESNGKVSLLDIFDYSKTPIEMHNISLPVAGSWSIATTHW